MVGLSGCHGLALALDSPVMIWSGNLVCTRNSDLSYGACRSKRSSVGRITPRAVVAGDGEEVKESETVQLRPKSVSSRGVKPAGLRRPVSGFRGGRPLKEISALVDGLTEFMSPREKGDIRDVLLMCLSFAVFIYISQHLVHAYCMLRHNLHSIKYF